MTNRFFFGEDRKAQSMIRSYRGLASWLGCLAVIVMITFASNANAQLSGKGAITGTVTDSTGAVIPNATVIATNGSTGIETQTKTTGAGAYNFANLDPGIYSVTITAEGFQKLKQENIHVNAMESQAFNPAMTIGRADVEVTVSAEPPQIETSNATLGATMEQETYAALPVEMGAYGQADQRRATDFVYLMPGVQGNNTNGNATTNVGVVNGSGSRGAASAVYVDGLPFVRAGGNGDPRYVWTAISVDAVDQFQVQTTGYSALYEGQGVMNYTVKRGGNQYHGSVYEFLRNTAFDTWGFFGKAPNPATGQPVKPIEHSNEYGLAVGGPLIPFGGIKDKLYFFTNYNGFRYSSATPTPITFPTAAQQNGDFSAAGLPKIYDPLSIHPCLNTKGQTVNCRDQFSYNGVLNVIPPSRFSSIAKAMQSFLPTSGISNSLSNNYIAPNQTGLTNWSTTSRIDYTLTSKDTISAIGAVGRQASSVPVGQTTAGRNVGPVPYNWGQAYAPKTAVWILEETHVFTPNLINQLKWGYARYNGPTFTPDKGAKFAASALGIGGTPKGQATDNFPIVTFTGTNSPTGWGGTTENSTIAQNYSLLDNLQWNFGKHSLTFGGQIAWMLYNTASATNSTTPITLANANTETAQFADSNTSTSGFTMDNATGFSYASFLLGQIDKGSFTDYSLHPVYGARFRAISPWVQDDWKVNSKLTLNLGLRYDFFPTVREVNNIGSYFDPNATNPVTGLKGALAYTGTGSGTCNCSTPVNNYFKNFGPRIGLAYQLDSKTVIRASYGVMFTHGDAVGGLASSIGTLGFSSAPSFSSTKSQTTMTNFLAGGSGVIPTYSSATGVSSGPAYGTGYTTASGFTGTPSTMGYADPYYGSRAPEYINWSFGLQRQLTNTIALNASYVGSEGHFLQLDNNSARGYWSNGLDPKYLALGSKLGDTGTAIATDCTANNLPCASQGLSIFNTSQPLSQLLKPFPFQGVTDQFGYVGNANYHALQSVLTIRNLHGLTTTVNYTWSRAIDDGGYFRTGYAIPAGAIYNAPNASYPADRIERTVSTSNQPHHFVATTVWKWPLGKSILGENSVERAILGGFNFSGVFQAYSGSPLMITMSSCNTNPVNASSTFCPPSYNPSFAGLARINGKWGNGVTLANYSGANGVSFIDKNAFIGTPNYFIGNVPRTAPYNIYGPGNYQLDLGMTRSFPLHLGESTKLDFRAEWYNVTNHTLFGVASTAFGNSAFGQVTTNPNANRKAAQFSARVAF
jgi:hypothetical protein